MTYTDEVFTLFKDANPVPDVDDIHAGRVGADRYLSTIVDVSRGGAGTTGSRMRDDRRVRPQARLRWGIALAAFALVTVVGGASALVITNVLDDAPELTPVERVEAEALDTVIRWREAIATGDVSEVLALSAPAASELPDERLYEALAVFAASGAGELTGACEIVSSSEAAAQVRCEIVLTNPVAVALGVDNQIAEYRYEEGLVTWLPEESGDISEINRAVASYLREFFPAEYERVCQPSAYDLGTIVIDQGLALTGDCATLTAPLLEDIATWVYEGRPLP